MGLRKTWRSVRKRLKGFRTEPKRGVGEPVHGDLPVRVQSDISEVVTDSERALRVALQEQVAGQQKVILEQQARISDLEGRLKTSEAEGEKAQQKIRELEFRIELSRAELIRSKGQIDFVRDLMLQQVRL